MEWWYRDRYKLPVTDDRFLDLTPDDMLLDAWAAYYEKARIDGKGEILEDDEFDLNKILADLDNGDAWESVDDWKATD